MLSRMDNFRFAAWLALAYAGVGLAIGVRGLSGGWTGLTLLLLYLLRLGLSLYLLVTLRRYLKRRFPSRILDLACVAVILVSVALSMDGVVMGVLTYTPDRVAGAAPHTPLLTATSCASLLLALLYGVGCLVLAAMLLRLSGPRLGLLKGFGGTLAIAGLLFATIFGSVFGLFAESAAYLILAGAFRGISQETLQLHQGGPYIGDARAGHEL